MMSPFTDEDLALLVRLNELRRTDLGAEGRALEERFRSHFGVESRLAVYGTLAPGRSNHHQLSDLDGEWIVGLSIRGTLEATGWGAAHGYPALRWSADGSPVDTQLFVSPDLPDHWPRLDRFEGADYLRVLAPVYRGAEVVAVANLYATSGA